MRLSEYCIKRAFPKQLCTKVKSVALIIAVDSPRNFAEKFISKAKLASINTK